MLPKCGREQREDMARLDLQVILHVVVVRQFAWVGVLDSKPARAPILKRATARVLARSERRLLHALPKCAAHLAPEVL